MFVQFPASVKTAADFTVGQTVTVIADQGHREGVVTKVARTRITVSHPRNKQGDMVERAYPMSSVVVGQVHDRFGWTAVTATGGFGGPNSRTPIAHVSTLKAV